MSWWVGSTYDGGRQRRKKKLTSSALPRHQGPRQLGDLLHLGLGPGFGLGLGLGLVVC